MLKKIGFVTATAAAAMVIMGGFASADEAGLPGLGQDGDFHQSGLLNLNNLDLLHNVNANLVLSPGSHEAVGATPESCATSALVDGGSIQDN
jgi:hypothetical protein